MGLYASDHPDVPGMRGLHLYHFALSNCSQRVRLALEEKGLDWTSHHLDLPGNEHLTSDYGRLNPNRVVPTLVHDGRVVIESNDILGHLEASFPEPALRPADAEGRARMQALVDRASAFQGAFKVISHDRIFRPFRKIGPSELALYERAEAPALAAFMRDYAENGEAWRARVESAETELADTLDGLEAALGEAPWLSGDAYGLADVSWVVNVHRFGPAGVTFEAHPRLAAWGERATSRPAFDRAVASYVPG